MALSGSSSLDFKNNLFLDPPSSDMENSMDTLPGTPLSKTLDTETEFMPVSQSCRGDTTVTPAIARRDGRIRSETMLSRIGSFIGITESVNLENLFEYDWADSDSESAIEKTKESYVVQELLADFLNVKSFKRKYPDLARRTMDAYERSWLQQEGLVPLGRADLGLTALRTDEVMRLLQTDYPDVFTALDDLFRRRRFQKAAELQKQQYEAARIERGEARAEAARRRAIESATDFNHSLITSRLTSRRCYWDLQTMQIHVPQPGYSLLPYPGRPNGAYPVAVLPGQFADYFLAYTPDQLFHLPLSQCLYSQPTQRPRGPPPPLPPPECLRFGSFAPRLPEASLAGGGAAVGELSGGGNRDGDAVGRDRDVRSLPVEEHNSNAVNISPKPSPDPRSSVPPGSNAGMARSSSSSTGGTTTATPSKAQTVAAVGNSARVTCRVCRKETQTYLRCSQCSQTGHPGCLDISEAMLPFVKSYPWSCMDCKCCVECHDSGHEEEMMFCDQCDRGYHAFCVGLEQIPEGCWECPLCVNPPKTKSGQSSQSRAVTSAKRRRQSTASSRRSTDQSRKRRRVSKQAANSSFEDTSPGSGKQVEEPFEGESNVGKSEEIKETTVKPENKRRRRSKPLKRNEESTPTSPECNASDQSNSPHSVLKSSKRRRGRPPVQSPDRVKPKRQRRSRKVVDEAKYNPADLLDSSSQPSAVDENVTEVDSSLEPRTSDRVTIRSDEATDDVKVSARQELSPSELTDVIPKDSNSSPVRATEVTGSTED